MNTTKRIPLRTNNAAKSWPYLGFGALVVALIAVTGIVAVRADRSNADAHNGTPPAAVQPLTAFDAPVLSAVRPLLTYYLVDSPEQVAMANALEAEAQSAAAMAGSNTERRHNVYQITSPEEEASTFMTVGATASELAEGGAWDFQVIDLRIPN